MSDFFPRQTVVMRFEEPTAIRRLSLSLWEMAIITGVVLRIFRSLALTHQSDSWLYLGGTLGLGTVTLLFMASAHLANYTLKRWWWRAPLFAATEVVAECVTSLALIWLGREPNGSVRASFADWPKMAVDTLETRMALVVLWTLILAASVTIVRRTMKQEEGDDDEGEALAGSREGRSSSGSTVLH